MDEQQQNKLRPDPKIKTAVVRPLIAKTNAPKLKKNSATVKALTPILPVTPQGKSPREKAAEIKMFARWVFAFVFLFVGFQITKVMFFAEWPFFGLHFLVEVLAGVVMSLFGFYILPVLLVNVKYWFEYLLAKTIGDIVSAFWEQQTTRIHEARREKQKRKAQEQIDRYKSELVSGILVDTSVLVDGRILDLVKTGFFDRTLIIPDFVINELHLISDNKDKIKRTRGRRGLDIIRELKKVTKVSIYEKASRESHDAAAPTSAHTTQPNLTRPMSSTAAKNPLPPEGVDKKLVHIAKEHNLKLLTLDFNLNKVAALAGVKVLNLNDLINALKTILLPGEETTIKIIQEGKEKQQGIGYLTDGTLIIVDNARDKVGQDVTVRVAKVIQSAAGKIVFCDLIAGV